MVVPHPFLPVVGQLSPPDETEARRLLSDELWRPEYAGSWWDRFKGWLADRLLLRAGDVDLSATFVVALVVITAALLVMVVIMWWRRRRLPEPASTGEAVFDGEPVLTADAYRTRATDHAAAGRWDAALLDRYRAVTASAVARGLTPDSPDLTAHEVGAVLSRGFPPHADRIRRAGVLFDLVRYGGGHADPDDVGMVEQLDDDLERTTPASGDARGPVPAVPR